MRGSCSNASEICLSQCMASIQKEQRRALLHVTLKIRLVVVATCRLRHLQRCYRISIASSIQRSNNSEVDNRPNNREIFDTDLTRQRKMRCRRRVGFDGREKRFFEKGSSAKKSQCLAKK